MIATEKYYGTNIVPVSEPNITERELEYITDAVKSIGISSTGKYIDHFESMFANYIGTKNASTVSNGTVALHVALLSLGIGPSDEVIVPALTYIATANAVTYTGATPVFTDSEPDTWNMYPVRGERPDTFFYRATSCWGWGTWKRAWDKFEPDVNKLLAGFQDEKNARNSTSMEV